jgi:hypothetical protein
MHGNSFALKHPSQRGQALRHFCRNPHCRSKLQEPTANLHRAFCVHGCHQQFYRLRCIVCEKELPPGRSDRRFCRKPSCRNQYYRNPVLFDFNAPKLGLGTGRAHLASKSSIKPGTFSSDSGDRPWRIVAAGSAISANAYHCASLPIDPDTARRTVAANDWGRIRQEIAWSRRVHRQRDSKAETAPPVIVDNPYLDQIPDDLSIPGFLRRVPETDS